MNNIKQYIKYLLCTLVICNCYSMQNNQNIESKKYNGIENYYKMTFQEFNKRLIWILNDMDFKIKSIINYINIQMDHVFPDKNPDNVTKIFQNNLENEYNKLKSILNEINEQYEKISNTNNKLNIKDSIIQYRESIVNIYTLLEEYIQKNIDSNNYYNKTISYVNSYFNKDNCNKKLLQELVTFLQDMIIKGKFLYNLWMSFYVEYKNYYGRIYDFSNWEIII